MAMSGGSYAGRVVATAVVATDGTGDFTTIQAAIDSLPAGGGVVYVKEGTYTITTAIRIGSSNTSIIGAGASTIITTSTDNIDLITSSNKDNLLFSQLFLESTVGSSNLNTGIFIFNGNTCIITNIWIKNIRRGIDLSGVDFSKIDPNIEGSPVTDEIALQMANCHRNSIAGVVSTIAITTGISMTNSTLNIISNCDIENATTGISLSANCNYNVIIGNILKDNTTDISDAGTGNDFAHNQS